MENKTLTGCLMAVVYVFFTWQGEPGTDTIIQLTKSDDSKHVSRGRSIQELQHLSQPCLPVVC